MSQWPSTRARRVLAALIRIGWTIKRQTGSHRTLSRPGWPGPLNGKLVLIARFPVPAGRDTILNSS
ncbi:MAG: type II toxin-antitoxin system HicA family toxin [Deltaproteobacteria bacterium]|nr:type II toxin-antitoxin system HicA family toxin [Deltaproteobacteria bacterium]